MIHNGGGQFIPMTRRCLYACMLLSQPRLMQAIFYTRAIVPEDKLGMYMDIVLFCEGSLASNEMSKLQENTFIVEAYVPARNCALLDTRVGRIGVSVEYSFDQWQIMDESPFEEGKVKDIIDEIRARNELGPPITLDRVLDKL
jgi:elongation factor 2